MAKKSDTVSLDGKDNTIKSSITQDNMNSAISTLSQSIKASVINIGTDIKYLNDSINKANSDIIDAHNEINTLRRENKALYDKLSDSRSRIVLLEENYNNLMGDLNKSTKIDLFIYAIFAICIICLAYEVYILTH